MYTNTSYQPLLIDNAFVIHDHGRNVTRVILLHTKLHVIRNHRYLPCSVPLVFCSATLQNDSFSSFLTFVCFIFQCSKLRGFHNQGCRGSLLCGGRASGPQHSHGGRGEGPEPGHHPPGEGGGQELPGGDRGHGGRVVCGGLRIRLQ